MNRISLFQTIIDYLSNNNYNYKSNNESNVIKIISDESHIINITIKPITEIIDFHLIDTRSIDVLYQISFFYNVPNDNQITNTILEQIKILNKVCYIINNIPNTVNNKDDINNNIQNPSIENVVVKCANCKYDIPNSRHCDTCFNSNGFKPK